ncbi:MAG: 4-deoxy-4-formamido-L-arabinose-phosphoundecaprenol deformylase [Bdellovibrionales bacterium]|nr:4-deoxy-4-formamido-L-arabinose-phosphoundecaprenol deformylase [Bdellovibrionales bacterium]
MTKVGLRIDVDTFRGTKLGVPNLIADLAEFDIHATFYFSVGPDNMGRHLWRLLKPAFLVKMLRSKAASLYGWDILLCGTFGSGPQIGKRLPECIRAVHEAGHEIGLHAWDHYSWQTYIHRMDRAAIHSELLQGFETLESIVGEKPRSAAAPGWRCNDTVLLEKSELPFQYNSDCRGESVFYPQVNGRTLAQAQIPVTLPTYDEVIGKNGISDDTYNEFLLSCVKPDGLNVLTIHAEVEGLARRELFRDFLRLATNRGMKFVPLVELLPSENSIAEGHIAQLETPGREGKVAVQTIRA